MSQKFDLVVIGAGPGGYVAAIRAGQLGVKTAIVERDRVGGVCLNYGCIPSKSLIHASGLFEKIQHADAYGFLVGSPKVDGKKLQEWKSGIVKRLTTGRRLPAREERRDRHRRDRDVHRHEHDVGHGRRTAGRTRSSSGRRSSRPARARWHCPRSPWTARS